MKISIGRYDYFDTKQEAGANRKAGEITNYEGGLGWYNYNLKEYQNNPRKKLFGF